MVCGVWDMSEDQAFYDTCAAVSADYCPACEPKPYRVILVNKDRTCRKCGRMVQSGVRVSTDFLPERKMRSPEEVREALSGVRVELSMTSPTSKPYRTLRGMEEAFKWVLNEQPEGEKT